jgi:methyltransferase (TIGR00027 family)
MRDQTPSRTAAWVAAARAAGMLLPEEIRIADDIYGAAFASPRLQHLLDRARGGSGRGSSAAVNIPGLGEWVLYMQVRTRVLDDAVRDFAAEGGRQLVILGAGYDCRALRLPELEDALVLEVDHPATQGHKQITLERLGARSPSKYIHWNFETRAMSELPAALAEAGHDPATPTLTLWEGVTMYLTEPTIDASVRSIAAYSAPGSRLAMTYFNRSRIERPSLATRALKSLVARIGEPWKWGWDPAELPAWMEQRGFQVTTDVSLADAARALFPADLAGRVGDPGRRVAVVARESVAMASR